METHVHVVKCYTFPRTSNWPSCTCPKKILLVATDYRSLYMYLTVLKLYMNSIENSIKPDINSLVNSVDPDQLASLCNI